MVSEIEMLWFDVEVDITNAYRSARVGGGGHIRAEALRSSRLSAVNYKFAPLGASGSGKP
jgi:hypothetical protein